MQIGSTFWQSRALYVAARLDLATTLSDRRLSVADLSTQLDADQDALHRLLRMLSAMGIFEIGRDVTTLPACSRFAKLHAALATPVPPSCCWEW
jgi:predicted transcriptional regulator